MVRGETNKNVACVAALCEVRPVDSLAVAAAIAQRGSESGLMEHAHEPELEEDGRELEGLEGLLVVHARECEERRCELDSALSGYRWVVPRIHVLWVTVSVFFSQFTLHVLF